MTITLNSDMGESLGIHAFGNDDELIAMVDLANVACGFHSGDPSGIGATVTKAVAASVKVGAHPGLPDIVGFGRRSMGLFPDEVRDLVRYQVGALVAFLDAAGGELNHLKPHGALYGMVARDEALMGAVCDVAAQYQIPVLGMAGTAHEKVARERGIPFIAEFYVDLEYGADGSLIIDRRPHATSVERAVERTVLAVTEGAAIAHTGERIPMQVQTICVHSDTPNAVEVATAVRSALNTTIKKEADHV